MCGIAGVVADGPGAAPVAALDLMARAIRFRGRDAEGAWHAERVDLLHSRLAVVDLEHGQQPMVDRDEVVAITFGGEVHNYVELRRELEGRGATFRTQSDTEVILEGYKAWGAAVCDRLVGMFAFALWDTRREELVLARDRLGEKPLYWFRGPDALWFASSCDAFRACPGWSDRLSERGLAEYFAAGAALDDRTVFEAAHALPPGCWAVVRPGDRAPRLHRYWTIGFEPTETGSDDDLVDRYEAILTDAVAIRLRTDVPSVLFFSGGVDSGLIAALAIRHLGAPLHCLTVDRDTEDDRSVEVARARDAAAAIGVPWTLDSYDYGASYLDDLRESYASFDQPSGHFEVAQIGRMAATAARHAKVALNGNGADELLLGYPSDLRIHRLDAATAPLRALGLGRFVDPADRLAKRLARAAAAGAQPDLDVALLPTLVELRDRAATAGVRSATDLKTYFTLTWGATEVNHRVPDIVSLTHQVEFRAPFFDHRVVDFATRLPRRLRIRGVRSPRGTKWIAKELYARLVGPDLAWRPKLGMGANLRWDLDLVRRPDWREFVESGLDAVAAHGLDPAGGRAAWVRYQVEVDGTLAPETYTTLFRHLMLGLWLDRRDASR